MKILFIGGTGTISTACSRLAVDLGYEVALLNRGKRPVEIPGTRKIVADIHDPASVENALGGERFDVVANFINFMPEHIERDLELFKGRAGQYLFISSASVYQKPLATYLVTESTPLKNPFWQYSRDKIACEERLNRAYREDDFPMVIVRPSYTYDDKLFPLAVGGGAHFTVADRMLKGLPVVIHGDGSSLWTNTHADDFAKAFVGLFGNPQTLGEAFHITSDEVLSWRQIYETLAHELGVEANVVYVPSDFIAQVDPGQAAGLLGDKAYSAVLDNTKIKRFVPTYQATIPLREGFRRNLVYYHADPSRKAISERENASIEKILATWGRIDPARSGKT